jgi:hypothetical protein
VSVTVNRTNKELRMGQRGRPRVQPRGRPRGRQCGLQCSWHQQGSAHSVPQGWQQHKRGSLLCCRRSFLPGGLTWWSRCRSWERGPKRRVQPRGHHSRHTGQQPSTAIPVQISTEGWVEAECEVVPVLNHHARRVNLKTELRVALDRKQTIPA